MNYLGGDRRTSLAGSWALPGEYPNWVTDREFGPLTRGPRPRPPQPAPLEEEQVRVRVLCACNRRLQEALVWAVQHSQCHGWGGGEGEAALRRHCSVLCAAMYAAGGGAGAPVCASACMQKAWAYTAGMRQA